MKNETKKQQGITLVTLVITIIVLCILAGVVINLAVNSQGLFGKANEAVEKWNTTVGEEQQATQNLLQEIIMSENIDKIIYGVPIPKGFYYVGGNAETGAIISDNKEDENKGESYEATKQLKGNQFVWIPVKNAICSEEVILNNEADKEVKINEVIDKINNDTNKMGYPMSIKIKKGEETEYVGVLYNIELVEEQSESETIYTTNFTALSYSRENGSFREPDVASTADTFPQYLSIVHFDTLEQFEKEKHESYNNMVESVAKYGGFYIARYETCLPDEEDKNETIVFKQGRNVINNTNWYQFYTLHKEWNQKAKEYISSETIWGSQWDQLMLYMKEVKNELASNKPYIIDGKGKSAEADGNKKESGSNEQHSVKNIFDIAGNVYEYTQATRSATTHEKRSSCYQKGSGYSANRRNYVIIKDETNVGSIYDGGRCSFWIK